MLRTDTTLKAALRRVMKSGATRRMTSCEAGAAAVEFALIAVPFLATVFWIINTALVFFAQQTLQSATDQAARLVMTGQAQQQGLSAQQFKQGVCANAAALFSCSGISLNIQTFSSFSSGSMYNPNKSGTFDNSGFSYSLGNSGDIEVIQVFYQWPVFGTLLGSLSNMGVGYRLLVATAAFRNEPY
jgi:Flp pilus assembly protein TadG